MVSTRHRTYFESPKPALHQPAAQQPAPRKPVQRRPVQRRPVQRRPAQQNPAQGAKTKKVGKKAKPTIEEDEEALDEEQDAVEQDDDVEEEAVDNDAAPNPKSGRKRPTTDVNEGSSRKVRKTRAAGPSNRNATGSGPPSGDAAGVEQAPVPKKVKDKGKGKETEEEAAAAAAATDANSWFEPADGTQNHFEDSKSAKKFAEARAATLKEWSSQPPKYGPHVWKGGAGLGSGSYGAAWAFYREDGHGVVFERIAVKDTVLRRDHWMNWARWWGAPWDTKNREHMEIKVMQDIAGDAKASRCVFIRGSEHYDDMYTYRIIMNYCPFGTMHRANPGPQDRPAPRKNKKTTEQSPEIYDDDREIPEPLVWKWFEDLAKACVLLQNGKDLPSDSPSRLSGQHVIVHRDIKPPNIFLDVPSEEYGEWPGYPVATLGDFGSAIYTNDEDEHNPMSYNYGEGTPGFTPLELYSMSDADTKRYKPMGKLGSATNIWSLGASLISICNRDPEPKTDFYSPEMAIPRFNDNAQHFYSQELRDLLSACVRYRGDDRIGAQDLLDSISRLTAGPEAGPDDADLANGLREGYSMIAGAEPIWQPSIKERYRTGMSYAEGEEGRSREEQEDADKAQEEKERRKKEAADAKAAAAKAEKEVAKGAVKGKPGKKKKQKK